MGSIWMVLVTSTSMIGCGAIFEPPPFLCHCCNWDVQAMGACESSSSNRSFVEAQLNKENLHNLNMRANTWLQNPTLPAMHEQQALLTPPGKMHRAIFRVCGGSFFSTCFWNKNTSYTEFPRDIRHPRIVWLLTSLLGPCGGLCPRWIFPNLRYGDSFRLW